MNRIIDKLCASILENILLNIITTNHIKKTKKCFNLQNISHQINQDISHTRSLHTSERERERFHKYNDFHLKIND